MHALEKVGHGTAFAKGKLPPSLKLAECGRKLIWWQTVYGFWYCLLPPPFLSLCDHRWVSDLFASVNRNGCWRASCRKGTYTGRRGKHLRQSIPFTLALPPCLTLPLLPPTIPSLSQLTSLRREHTDDCLKRKTAAHGAIRAKTSWWEH